VSRRLGEFELIAEYFAPLATAPGAFALGDDAGQFEVPVGQVGMVTTDTMVEDIHFFANDPGDVVGWKLLAVNLSDLAAMGATPLGYTLDIALSEERSAAWLRAFVNGLAECQRRFGTSLLGGDTVRATGPLTLTITAIGAVPAGAALRRNGAKEGDAVWVSGTIGDGALEVKLRKGWTPPAGIDVGSLSKKLNRPEPRLALGVALRGHARAAIDVSDGLAADLGHICEQSDVGAEVWLADVPLSPAAAALLAADPALAATIVAGGDDYELLFTAAESETAAVLAAARDAETPIARIGRVTAEPGVRIVGRDGKALALDRLGFTHF